MRGAGPLVDVVVELSVDDLPGLFTHLFIPLHTEDLSVAIHPLGHIHRQQPRAASHIQNFHSPAQPEKIQVSGIDQLVENLRARRRGAGKSSDDFILEGGLTLNNPDFTKEDIDFLAWQGAAKRKICQVYGIFLGLHEGALPDFHVQDNGIRAGSDLLAHDRAGDQGQALYGARHVAQGVELSVGRRQVGRLARHHQAYLAQLAAKTRLVQAVNEAAQRDALADAAGTGDQFPGPVDRARDSAKRTQLRAASAQLLPSVLGARLRRRRTVQGQQSRAGEGSDLPLSSADEILRRKRP